MTDLCEMDNEMILRGLSANTRRSYLRYYKQFHDFFKNHPSGEFSGNHIKIFLSYLIREKKVNAKTSNVAVYALKFFFNIVLDKNFPNKYFPVRRENSKLPEILTISEINEIIQATRNIKYRTLFMIIYGAGLRPSEATSLKIKDIDSKRMLIHVRNTKVKKDRFAILPEKVLIALRKYWLTCKPKKYLFPGRISDQPISYDAAAKMYKTIKKRTSITKSGNLHSLRHAFASHLLENGEDIYTIKDLLGHACIKSTVIYLQLSKHKKASIVSPVEQININW